MKATRIVSRDSVTSAGSSVGCTARLQNNGDDRYGRNDRANGRDNGRTYDPRYDPNNRNGNNGNYSSLLPSSRIPVSVTRSWADANRNFNPDCNLQNPQANGECGTVVNLGFGQPSPTTTWAETARKGWGVREFNYQTSVALQHELRPGFGLTVGYYRTDWRNQQAIVNNAVSPSDFTPFCVDAPTDARLGSVSGRPVCGLARLIAHAGWVCRQGRPAGPVIASAQASSGSTS